MGVEVRFEAKDDAVVAGDEMNDEEEEGTDEIAGFVNMYGLAVSVTRYFPVPILVDYSMEEQRSVKAMKPDFVTLSTRDCLRWMRSLYLMLLLKVLDMKVEGLL